MELICNVGCDKEVGYRDATVSIFSWGILSVKDLHDLSTAKTASKTAKTTKTAKTASKTPNKANIAKLVKTACNAPKSAARHLN